MLYAIEHSGLHCSIVVHILKREAITGFQWLPETPVAHIVTAQAGISAKPIARQPSASETLSVMAGL